MTRTTKGRLRHEQPRNDYGMHNLGTIMTFTTERHDECVHDLKVPTADATLAKNHAATKNPDR